MRCETRVEGHCSARFERLRQAFSDSLLQGEVGAALALTLEGRLVVDLWGGFMDRACSRPWQRDTLVNVYSATKGMVALCAHKLVECGRLDLEAPVSDYWPQFAQAGKQDTRVHHLLSHKAGLAALSRRITLEHCYDWDFMTSELAAQEPWWTPGTRHGYHLMTFGYLIGELVRRVERRTLGVYFQEEIAAPLGAEFYMGLGAELEPRCAEVIAAPPAPSEAQRLLGPPGSLAPLTALAISNPRIHTSQVNTSSWRRAQIPSVNGHGTARGLALIYGALAQGGKSGSGRLLHESTIRRARTEQAYGPDAVLPGFIARLGLGFFLTQPNMPFGPNPGSFGHPGYGGSVAFADPDARLGFAYVMNQLHAPVMGGGRGFDLIRVAYEALG